MYQIMANLRSEHIRKKLFWSMIAIILCILLISLPLIYSSYQYYKKASTTLVEINSMRAVAELANKVSRERAPANKLMSGAAADFHVHQQELKQYRSEVDIQFQQTVDVLKQSGFQLVAVQLEKELGESLRQARHDVDRVSLLSAEARTSAEYDYAVRQMFSAWDRCYEGLRNVLLSSVAKDTTVSSYYTTIFILADLRDQAGRMASNILPYVSFNERIPKDNLVRSLQTQKQISYLWDLINTLQQDNARTPEYTALHHQVKTEFLDQGIPMVSGLIEESINGLPYSVSGVQLTEKMVSKFATVVDLQHYLLDYSQNVAEDDVQKAGQRLGFRLILTLISLGAAVFTLLYARNKVFKPLIYARNTLLDLSQYGEKKLISEKALEKISLLEAIQKLQGMLRQRDVLENQLRNHAATDNLTGVSNRMALDEYVSALETSSSGLLNTGLIVLDIDNFKQINDSYGHVVGDQVICFIADQLKRHVRSDDLVVRYGGDEFLILFAKMQIKTLFEIAEKIRTAIADNKQFDQFSISVSSCVAVGAENWEELLVKADQALLRAKENGKNIVEA